MKVKILLLVFHAACILLSARTYDSENSEVSTKSLHRGEPFAVLNWFGKCWSVARSYMDDGDERAVEKIHIRVIDLKINSELTYDAGGR